MTLNRFLYTGRFDYQGVQQKQLVRVTLSYNAVGSRCAHRSWKADGAPRGNSGCPWYT